MEECDWEGNIFWIFSSVDLHMSGKVVCWAS